MVTFSHRSNNPFSRYVRLLLQLHHLMSAGKSESDEAEEVRDRMDAPWVKLSTQELALVNGLSEDLYTVGVDREPAADRPEPIDHQRFQAAVESGKWAQALDTLRENEQRLPPDEVAYLRAVCWWVLGEPAVAVEFLQEVARIRSLKDSELAMLLTCMVQAGETEAAMPHVEHIERTSENPLLLLKAAVVLSFQAFEVERDKATVLRRRSIALAERGLASDNDFTDEFWDRDAMQSVRQAGLLYLAMDYEELGENAKALEACQRALQIDPQNPNALMFWGWLHSERPSGDRADAFRSELHHRVTFEPPFNAPAAYMAGVN